MKKFKNQRLNADAQRNVVGGVKPGLPANSPSCPTVGCFPLFFQDSSSSCCAVPGPGGEICYGTSNGFACCFE
ncbi:hypothetical protein BKI52_23525 [marine bacterium AO1-C]|nr:hypothetical protein BKI52_23525 [marine bacterium AO1-C]